MFIRNNPDVSMKVSSLEGYYTVKTLEYCYLVSWRVANQIPGSKGFRHSRFSRYLCRKCTPGPLKTVCGKGTRSMLQNHLLDQHKILADINYSCSHTPNELYRLIPTENFVKGKRKEYPDEVLWRWVEAFEEDRLPPVVGTPPAVHEVEAQGDHSGVRQSPASVGRLKTEERSTEQVHWNEDLWLFLINTLQKIEDQNTIKGKWNMVSTMLPPRFVRKFSKVTLGQSVIQNRFLALSWEIQNNRKRNRYTRGVTEAVIKRMEEYCKRKKLRVKNARERGADCKKREAFKTVPSTEEILNLEPNKQFNSLVRMLDNQLIPTMVKQGFESCVNISKRVLSEKKITPKVLKLAVKVAYQKKRGVIISILKQYTHSLGQELDLWKVAN